MRTYLRLFVSWVVLGIAVPALSQPVELSELDSLLAVQITSASKYQQTSAEAPASVAVITREDILRYGYRDLAEVLMMARGLFVTNDRNYPYLGVRGFGRPDYNSRILLLQNGHTLNENIFGSSGIGSDGVFDLDNIDRIEVIHGPGSALYGTGAMLAVINIVTRKAHHIDRLVTSATAGSFGSYQATARLYRATDDIDFMASAIWERSDGPDYFYSEYNTADNNFGVAHKKDWERSYGFTSTLTWKQFTAQGTYKTREKGIPTGAFEVLFNDPRSRTLDRRAFAELKYEQPLSTTLDFHARAFYDHYEYTGGYPYPAEDSAYAEALVDEISTGNWFGTETTLQWDPTESARLLLGAELKEHYQAEYYGYNAGNTVFHLDYPFSERSAFLQLQWDAVEDLSLYGGLRLDKDSRFPQHLSPRASAVYSGIKDFVFKYVYGSSYRVPNLYEAYYEDTATAFGASTDLRPETITTHELNIQHELADDVFAIGSLYRYVIKDLIDQRIDPTDSMIRFQNLQEASTLGGDILIRAHMGASSAYLTYSYHYTVDQSTGERLTNSPLQILNGGCSIQPVKELMLSTEFYVEGRRRTLSGNYTRVPFLVHGQVRYEPLDNLFLTFRAKNILNTPHEVPGGHEHVQDILLQPGRQLFVKLSYRL